MQFPINTPPNYLRPREAHIDVRFIDKQGHRAVPGKRTTQLRANLVRNDHKVAPLLPGAGSNTTIGADGKAHRRQMTGPLNKKLARQTEVDLTFEIDSSMQLKSEHGDSPLALEIEWDTAVYNPKVVLASSERAGVGEAQALFDDSPHHLGWLADADDMRAAQWFVLDLGVEVRTESINFGRLPTHEEVTDNGLLGDSLAAALGVVGGVGKMGVGVVAGVGGLGLDVVSGVGKLGVGAVAGVGELALKGLRFARSNSPVPAAPAAEKKGAAEAEGESDDAEDESKTRNPSTGVAPAARTPSAGSSSPKLPAAAAAAALPASFFTATFVEFMKPAELRESELESAPQVLPNVRGKSHLSTGGLVLFVRDNCVGDDRVEPVWTQIIGAYLAHDGAEADPSRRRYARVTPTIPHTREALSKAWDDGGVKKEELHADADAGCTPTIQDICAHASKPEADAAAGISPGHSDDDMDEVAEGRERHERVRAMAAVISGCAKELLGVDDYNALDAGARLQALNRMLPRRFTLKAASKKKVRQAEKTALELMQKWARRQFQQHKRRGAQMKAGAKYIPSPELVPLECPICLDDSGTCEHVVEKGTVRLDDDVAKGRTWRLVEDAHMWPPPPEQSRWHDQDSEGKVPRCKSRPGSPVQKAKTLLGGVFGGSAEKAPPERAGLQVLQDLRLARVIECLIPFSMRGVDVPRDERWREAVWRLHHMPKAMRPPTHDKNDRALLLPWWKQLRSYYIWSLVKWKTRTGFHDTEEEVDDCLFHANGVISPNPVTISDLKKEQERGQTVWQDSPNSMVSNKAAQFWLLTLKHDPDEWKENKLGKEAGFITPQADLAVEEGSESSFSLTGQGGQGPAPMHLRRLTFTGRSHAGQIHQQKPKFRSFQMRVVDDPAASVAHTQVSRLATARSERQTPAATARLTRSSLNVTFLPPTPPHP